MGPSTDGSVDMTFRIPPRMAYYTVESSQDSTEGTPAVSVFLRRVPGGPSLVLADVGALIWELAADGVDDVAAAVAEIVGHPLERVRPDVDAYLDSLLAQGLLERAPHSERVG